MVLRVANRMVGWFGPDLSMSERAGRFAAAAVVGPTFEPGLQPRKTIHQAIATGIVSATTLSTVTASQSFVEALGRAVTGNRRDTASITSRYLIGLGSNAVAAGVGLGVYRALPPRADEPLRRGLLRVAAFEAGRTGLIGFGLTGVFGALEAVAERYPSAAWVRRTPVALPAGIAVAAFRISRMHRRAKEYGDQTIADVAPGKSVGLALGVGAGVLTLEAAERTVAHQVARLVRRVAPGYANLASPIGHLVGLGALGTAGYLGYEYATRTVEAGGAAIEPAYQSPPDSPYVTGGPGSPVTFDSLSREGRRFVNMALPAAEIAQVMEVDEARDPVRVFVGLESSDVVDDRVDEVMDEMDRTGAWERKVLCFASPTGSGYVNYVLSEALEYLTLGDCATVAMQYSLLPSFLSLDRVALATEQNRALMHAITGRLSGMPDDRRPRFVLFGESLGAQTMQGVYNHRKVSAFHRDHVDAAIFLGTPHASEWARTWRLDPQRIDPDGEIAELDSYEEYEAIPQERRERIRYLLLTHHDDPIPKFGPSLLYQRPDWLGPVEERPIRVPRSTSWRPTTTFVLTLVDVINAMEVVPGTFGRRGHDYREDIARFVSDIYRLPTDANRMSRIEVALRQRELSWAEKRVVTEQLARAREAVAREMKTWGVSAPSEKDAASLLETVLSAAGSAPVA